MSKTPGRRPVWTVISIVFTPASVDLVVRADVHEKGLVVLPSEQDSQVVVNAERPVGPERALELVGPKEGILRIGGESLKRCP
jgi:hypothetical protein